MKKIWDTQNDRPLFVIDEKALLRRVLSKKKGSKRLSGINEAGLILINLALMVSFTFKAFGPNGSIHYLIIPATLLGVNAYILYIRSKRRKEERQYGRTLLDELDHAIASRHYLERMSSTMIWWYTVPLVIAVLVSAVIKDPSEAIYPKFLLIAGACLLSYLLTRYEYKKVHQPKRQELEGLRETLLAKT